MKAPTGPTWKRAPGPGRVSWGPAFVYSPISAVPERGPVPLTEEHPVEIFFETLLALVCVGVLAFAALTVKKLYQGQR